MPTGNDTLRSSLVPISVSTNDPNTRKWRNDVYSRHSRNLRKLTKTSTQYRKITEYFPLITENAQNVIEKHNLCTEIEKNYQCLQGTDSEPPSCKNIIKILRDTSLNNTQRGKNKKVYRNTLKEFCTYLYIIGGKLIYETLQANLKDSIPSLATVKRTIHGCQSIEEGQMRFRDLKNFLRNNGYPMRVWISEDQTKIVERVEYDSKTNKIVGCAPRMNNEGLAINANYATSAKAIVDCCTTQERASYAYIIMAQPLQNNSMPFCLCVYGSNNKFTFSSVLARWQYMQKTAEEYEIVIEGFSSDGDTRLMKSMRIVTAFPCKDKNTPESLKAFFQIKFDLTKPMVIQDTVHIGTKLRTRFLGSSIVIPLGNYIASKTHLEVLLTVVTKDKHLLAKNDLNCDDKMNFDAVEKISKEHVIELLNTHIPQSQGTVAYLKIIRFVLDSFLSKHLTPSERLYKIWFATLFLRILRHWILAHKDYTLKNNFITANSYMCIEFNAHALVIAILKFGEHNQDQHLDQHFLPWLFSTQPCEKLFRATRSMTSTFSTVVNFSLLDILKRIDRIHFLNNAHSALGNMIICICIFVIHNLFLFYRDRICFSKRRKSTNGLAK